MEQFGISDIVMKKIEDGAYNKLQDRGLGLPVLPGLRRRPRYWDFFQLPFRRGRF